MGSTFAARRAGSEIANAAAKIISTPHISKPSLVPQRHHGIQHPRATPFGLHYSIRKDSDGLIFEMRNVGKKLAANAISNRRTGTIVSVSGSS